MDTDQKSKPPAWQPITFGGVAAFGTASLGRLLLVQTVVAVISGVSLALFFSMAWKPSLDDSIRQLPPQAIIRGGILEWTGTSPALLSGRNFLAITVDLEGEGDVSHPSDLQCEFSLRQFRFRSLLGVMSLPYPAGWSVPLNHAQLEPWWGAWSPFIIAGIGVGGAMGLMVVWNGLAFLYCWPARLIAWCSGREASLAAAWRVTAAASLPGALLMSAALVAYGMHHINLLQLLFATALHFAITIIFVLCAPLRLPKRAMVEVRQNPFRPRTSVRSAKSKNPFRSGRKSS